MAKIDGIVEIQGTVKGVTFYRSKDGMLARAKGGISKKRMKTDPAFQRTRENGVEFGHNAKMSKLMRIRPAVCCCWPKIPGSAAGCRNR